MTETPPGEWLALGPAEDIKDGQSKSFTLPAKLSETPIAVFHHQGKWYALADRCTHANIPIADGPVKGGCLMCPWHYAEFDLKTGASLSGPATENIKTYPIRLSERGLLEIMILKRHN